LKNSARPDKKPCVGNPLALRFSYQLAVQGSGQAFDES
jgi:hypothetical protein